MKLLVRESEGEPWQDVDGAYRVLLRAVARRLQVLIESPNPDEEVDEMVSAIRLFRRAGGDAGDIQVEGAYPSAGWVESVRWAGARRVRVRTRCTDRDPATSDLPSGVCPALQARRCSFHYEEGDLDDRELVERCLGRWLRCPWYETPPSTAQAG